MIERCHKCGSTMRPAMGAGLWRCEWCRYEVPRKQPSATRPPGSPQDGGPTCRACQGAMSADDGVVPIWRCECGREIPRTDAKPVKDVKNVKCDRDLTVHDYLAGRGITPTSDAERAFRLGVAEGVEGLRAPALAGLRLYITPSGPRLRDQFATDPGRKPA